MQESDRSRQVHSTILMVFTLFSRLLGIFKARVIAVLFGATAVGDVINFTFNIPNNFRKLFAEGALNSAFIPIFTRKLSQKEDAGNLLSSMMMIQMLIMVPLIILIALFRTQIISFLSDFSDPAMISLSGNLLIFFTFYLLLISLYSLFTGVLNAHSHFITSAAAPLLFSIILIASLYLLEPSLGGYSMAVGVILGGSAQLLITWNKLRSFGYRWAFTIHPLTSDVKQVLRKWGFVTLNATIAIVSQQVAYYFASTLETGSVTSFSNAIIIWQAPYGIFYAAIATAFFPALVRATAKKDKSELYHIGRHGILLLMATLLPNLLLLSTFGSATASVLLQSGKFTLSDAMNTGSALSFFAFGMPAAALYGFFQRICYAGDRERGAFIIAGIVTASDVILTLLLLQRNAHISSIALANTLAFVLGTLIYIFYLIAAGHISLTEGRFLRQLLGVGAVNVFLYFLLEFTKTLLGDVWWQEGTSLASLGILSLIFLLTFLIAYALYTLFDVDILSFIARKRSRKD